jgi:hypothetical protein
MIMSSPHPQKAQSKRGRRISFKTSDKASPYDAAVALRLQKAISDHPEFPTLKAFAEALAVEATTFRGYSSGARTLPNDLAERCAKLLSTTTDWLLYGRGPEPWGDSQPTGIRLASEAAAGLLQTDNQLMHDSGETIPIPSEFATRNGQPAFAVRLTTSDLDRQFPPGSIIICADVDKEFTPSEGALVLVHRSTAFGTERVFRRIKIIGGEIWLCPDSNNPAYHEPWNYTKNDAPGSVIKIVAIAFSVTHMI